MNRSNLAIKEEYTIESDVDTEDEVINEVTIETEVTTNIKENKKVGILYTICKKVIDILAGIFGTILLIPVTIIVWLVRLIKHENDGPLFFEQLRIGKNGKQFRLYKFRTMVMNADEKLYKYLEENEEARKEYKKYKKLKDDPRITKLGAFLRKTSLDEFPQFINILKGDMSLVGPRPYLYREKIDMGDYYRIPADNRNLNYQKYENAGNADLEKITEYNSHNTERLDVEGMKKLLLKLDLFKGE